MTLQEYGESWLSSQTFDPSTREAVELRLRLHVYLPIGLPVPLPVKTGRDGEALKRWSARTTPLPVAPPTPGRKSAEAVGRCGTYTSIGERDSCMSVQYANEPDRSGSLEVSREELLRRGRPLPSYEDMVIDDLPEDEAEAFWAAINEA
jgi:hypothetical protein